MSLSKSQHKSKCHQQAEQYCERNIYLENMGAGYCRIPDFEKYMKWTWEVVNHEHAGNCYETNWNKYQELKNNGASVKLVVGKMRGIHHAFIIDGETRYDYSQFREIKEPLEDYLNVNNFTEYSFYTGDNHEEWMITCRLSDNGINTHHGQIEIDRSEGTMYNAMKSIINL